METPPSKIKKIDRPRRDILRLGKLGQRVLTWGISAIFVVLLVYESVSFWLDFQASREEFTTSMVQASSRVANSLSFPVWYVDERSSRAIMEAELKDPLISAIRLEKPDGSPFLESLDLGKKSENSLSWLYSMLGTSQKEVKTGVIIHNDHIIARFEIDFVYYQLALAWQKSLSRILVEFLLFTLGFTLFISAGYAFLINKPLKRILEGIMKVQSGDFQVRIPMNHEDELSQVATGIENMAHEIDSTWQRLERQNRNLDDLVKERTNRLVESEKRTVVSKLIAGIAHELNTPLGVMRTTITYLKTLREEVTACLGNGKLSRQGLDDYLARHKEGELLIDENVEHASNLISSFRQVSYDQFSEECVSFDLSAQVRNFLPTMKRIMELKDLDLGFTGEDHLIIQGYPNLMNQILVNLAMNTSFHAFHGESGSSPRVAICLRKISGGAELEYRNNGKPIPPESLPDIFEPFYSTLKGNGRTGLGLYVIKSLVEQQLEGSITVISPVENDRGVAFRIIIPNRASRSTETARQENNLRT